MACESTLSIENRGGALLAVIHGKMVDEALCTQLRAAIADNASGALPVVVDLSEVKVLPSLAIGVLLEMQTLRAQGRHLVVAGAQPMVRDVLHLTRVDQVLELSNGLDEALTRAGQPA